MSGNTYPWWAPAATLRERARQLANRTARSTTPNASADRRLERWRRQRPFDKPELFAKRLELESLTEPELTSLLDSHAAPNDQPIWVDAIAQAQSIPYPANTPAQRIAGDTDTTGIELAKAFGEPFVATALGKLFNGVRTIHTRAPDAPFNAERAVRLFEPSLWSLLINRTLKVIILELNVARVKGILTGNTPQERYRDFANLLRTTNLRQQILEEYPVLARSIVIACDNWQTFAGEFLEHLARDVTLIETELGNGQPVGELTELSAGAGDGHRQGRSVIVAEFSSGTRVVYKPRDLAVDTRFAEIVAWLNARGQSPPLKVARSINRGDHGWCEHIPNTPCASEEEVNHFYLRFGASLALLHALEATDFHYENVIASGPHPMLVDLEALFHPRPAPAHPLNEPEWLGWTAIQFSVLRAGVLPLRVFANDESSGIDMSAVGGGEAQRTPSKHPVIVDAGTDEMRLVREFAMLPPALNRPALGATPIDPLRYVDAITAGFGDTYRLLLRNRDDLLSTDGPLHRFADVPVRAVLRPTRHYALIHLESYHPDVLRDALDRDRLLDRLWVAVPAQPELERVIAHEHADLTVGDIPLFTTRPASHDLFTSTGQHIPNYFATTGLEAAIARIRGMSEQDLLRQQWIIQASLVALTPGRHGPTPVDPNGTPPARQTRPNADTPFPSEDACLSAAHLIAQRLSTLALREDNRTSWLGLTLLRDRDWTIQPITTELYAGTLGVALFLAYSASLTGDRDHEQLARDVITQSTTRLRDLTNQHPPALAGSLGAFGSVGGAIYALSHVGALWRDDDLIDLAAGLATAASDEAERDTNLDVINGVAGFIAAVYSLDHVRPSTAVRDAIRRSADRLVATAIERAAGVAWQTQLASAQPLTGFSHGASGIAAVLLAAAAMLDEPKYRDVALGALAYERTTFDRQRNNWPDYRILTGFQTGENDAFMWSWCHGAPGIGLARLIALQYVASRDLESELHTAITSTTNAGFGNNDSLCHGDLGNLELLLHARELGHHGDWESILATEASRAVERLAAGHWRCGVPGGVEIPGLMMGLAGIGYGLLRLGATTRVPSILSLEPPRLTTDTTR